MPYVLVAEDEASVRQCLERGLCRAGFEVLTARDGAEAVEIALASSVDAMVLDLLMPRLDGYEVIRRLQQEYEDKLPPVVMLVAPGADGSPAAASGPGEELFQDAPFQRYIRKPFVLETVIGVIRELLPQPPAKP